MTVPAMACEVSVADACPNNATVPSAPNVKPILSLVVAGSQPAQLTRVIITFTNASGESGPGPEQIISTPANNVVQVQSPDKRPSDPGGPTGWNCYMTNGATLTETKQNGSTPIALGTNFTEASSGLVGGSALPPASPNPALSSNVSNLANTPGATGLLAPPQSPSGAVVTNTGRTAEAAQTFMTTKLNVLNVGTTPPPAKN